jgi:hypothetical protein
LVVAEGKKRGTLYTLKSKLQKEDIVATATKEDPTTNLWHKILGHLTERGLKIHAEQKIFPRIATFFRSLFHSEFSLSRIRPFVDKHVFE